MKINSKSVKFILINFLLYACMHTCTCIHLINIFFLEKDSDMRKILQTKICYQNFSIQNRMCLYLQAVWTGGYCCPNKTVAILACVITGGYQWYKDDQC